MFRRFKHGSRGKNEVIYHTSKGANRIKIDGQLKKSNKAQGMFEFDMTIATRDEKEPNKYYLLPSFSC